MATAETVDLDAAHVPKEESVAAFEQVLPELKTELAKIRRDRDKHEKEYFAAVAHLSDADLTSFQTSDFTSVRAAKSAYGVHLFAQVRIPSMPDSGPAYIHVRIFLAGGDEPPKIHAIHTEEKEEQDGGKTYRAIFTKDDKLEWFDT